MMGSVVERGYSGAGASAAQRAEAQRLLQASEAALDPLPPGHAARDELRFHHLKLSTLASVAAQVEPAEWDEMLSSMLKAKRYGVEAIQRYLQQRGPWCAPFSRPSHILLRVIRVSS